MGRTQKQADERGIDQQHIFHRVVFFLAAITPRLFSRVLGADDASFGAVMGKRGDADAAVGPVTTGAGASSSGTTLVATSASATPSRWAKAVRERAGASPRVRGEQRRQEDVHPLMRFALAHAEQASLDDLQ